MTDILLGIIIAIILLQLHQKEKSRGWYGQLYTIIRKQIVRRSLICLIKVVKAVTSQPRSILKRNEEVPVIEEITYPCNLCSFTAKNETGLKVHLRRAHIACWNCGFIAKTQGGLKNHMRKHW